MACTGVRRPEPADAGADVAAADGHGMLHSQAAQAEHRVQAARAARLELRKAADVLLRQEDASISQSTCSVASTGADAA